MDKIYMPMIFYFSNVVFNFGYAIFDCFNS